MFTISQFSMLVLVLQVIADKAKFWTYNFGKKMYCFCAHGPIWVISYFGTCDSKKLVTK